MTVGELIEQLQQLPRDMRVLVPGYEGGFCIPQLMPVPRQYIHAPQEWCGEFARADDDGDQFGSFEAVVIAR